MKKKRRLAMLLNAGMLLSSGHAAAQDFGSRQAHAVSKGAAIVSYKMHSLYETACSAGRILGLCSEPEERGYNRRSLSLGSWRNVHISAKSEPNKFLKLAKLFIDNLQVAEIGNTKIKISLELR